TARRIWPLISGPVGSSSSPSCPRRPRARFNVPRYVTPLSEFAKAGEVLRTKPPQRNLAHFTDYRNPELQAEIVVTAGAIYDRALFLDQRNTRGHRPRLQFERSFLSKSKRALRDNNLEPQS